VLQRGTVGSNISTLADLRTPRLSSQDGTVEFKQLLQRTRLRTPLIEVDAEHVEDLASSGEGLVVRRARLGCLAGTFRPSCFQIRSTRLWFTNQPSQLRSSVILR
jgi:hypothetical protein